MPSPERFSASKPHDASGVSSWMMRRALVLGPLVAAACAAPPPPPPSLPRVAPAPVSSVTATEPALESARPTVCPQRRAIGDAAFSPDGARLATAMGAGCREASDATVDVWDLARGALDRRLDAGLACARLAWTKEGLASDANPDTGMSHLTLWSDPTYRSRVDVDYYLASPLAFDARGERAVTATAQGQIALFDLKSGARTDRPERDAHLGGDYAVGVTFSADGKDLLVEDQGDGLAILSARTLAKKPGVARHPRMLGGSMTSPNGSLVAVVEEPGQLEVYRTRDLSRVKTLEKSTSAVGIAGWLDDEHFFATDIGGGVALWSVDGRRDAIIATPAGRCGAVYPGPAHGIFAVSQPDCSIVVSVGPEKKELWRVDAPPEPPASPDDAKGAQARTTLSFSPRGDRVVLFFGDGTISIRDALSGRELTRTKGGAPDEVETVVWTPDERAVVFAASSLTMLRLDDGRRIDVTAFDREAGERVLVALDQEGAFSGPRELVPCAALARAGGRDPSATQREVPTLLADFFALQGAARPR